MCDHCAFVKKFGDDDFIILLLYVDDMLIVGHDANKIDNLKREPSKSFIMKDLGSTKQILGIKISHDKKTKKLWLSQEAYVERVLKRFNMSKAKFVCSPLASHFKHSSEYYPTSEKEKREMRGVLYASGADSFIYATVCTRPDIVHTVGVVGRFFSNLGKEHWTIVKWILKYLRGTSKACLCFGSDKPILQVYTDTDMARDVDFRKCLLRYLLTFTGEQSHGSPDFSNVLLRLPQKQSILQSLKVAKKPYG